MNNNNNIKQAIEIITTKCNSYLMLANGSFSNTGFIIAINKALSQFPTEINSSFRWKRKSLKDKPTLCLERLNVIIRFFEQHNAYKALRPDNLDVFL